MTKLLMKFKSMKEVTPKAASLMQMLHGHLNGPDKPRYFKTVHASELTRDEGFCPRTYALADLTGTTSKKQWLTTSEQVTFQMGRDSQDAIVSWFADMGKAVGDWKCRGCGHLHEFQKRPLKCEQCPSTGFKPEEVRFLSTKNGASCGIDMLVDMDEDLLIPVELKTMGKDQFKKLKAPLAEHRLRTNLYLRLISESDHPMAKRVNTSKARVLYVEKGGYGMLNGNLADWGIKERFSPFREYTITRDDKQTQDLAKRAKVVKDYRAGKVGVPRGICMTALSERAKHCQFKGVCFSGEHPQTYDWTKA